MDEKQKIDLILKPLFSNAINLDDFASKYCDIIIGPIIDDSAVINIKEKSTLVISSDYVRGPKFKLFELGLLSWYDIGYFLVIANLSDLAAMGAIPLGILTVVRYPISLEDSDFKEIFKGIYDAAKLYNSPVLGGDIGTAERVILSGSAIGICKYGKFLKRAGASVDDLICVTGLIGLPIAALIYFQSKGENISLDIEDERILLDSWKRPKAQVVLGQMLLNEDIATACQDISDGFKTSLVELTKSSHVGAIVDEDKLPISSCVEKVASLLDIDVTSLACSASVDFELIFTINSKKHGECQSLFEKLGQKMYVVGMIKLEEAVSLRRKNGEIVDLPGFEWKHQVDSVGLESIKYAK